MTTVRWRTVTRKTLAFVVVSFSSVLAATEHAGGGNTSPVIAVLLALAVVLLAAKIGGDHHGPLAATRSVGGTDRRHHLGKSRAARNRHVSLSCVKISCWRFSVS